MAFVSGDIVEVTDDTAELEEKYFGGAGARWKVGRLFNTNTEGYMACLTRVGVPAQRRNVLVSLLRRVELPPALR